MDELKVVVGLAPNETGAYTRIIEIYIKQNNLIPAKEYCLKLIKVDPVFSEGYFYLGMIYGIEGNMQEAIKLWEKVLVLDPKNTIAKENIEIAKRMQRKQ